MTQQEVVESLKQLKKICEEQKFEWDILSTYLMTEEEYEEWYMHELSKHESQTDLYENW